MLKLKQVLQSPMCLLIQRERQGWVNAVEKDNFIFLCLRNSFHNIKARICSYINIKEESCPKNDSMTVMIKEILHCTFSSLIGHKSLSLLFTVVKAIVYIKIIPSPQKVVCSFFFGCKVHPHVAIRLKTIKSHPTLPKTTHKGFYPVEEQITLSSNCGKVFKWNFWLNSFFIDFCEMPPWTENSWSIQAFQNFA